MKRMILPLLICLFPALPAQADEAALQERIEMLSKELEKLKQEMQEMNSRTEAIADQQQAVIEAAAPGTAESPGSQVSIWGYGEINYNRPTGDSSASKMDLRRAVPRNSKSSTPSSPPMTTVNSKSNSSISTTVSRQTSMRRPACS
jgi:hypothetical protein